MFEIAQVNQFNVKNKTKRFMDVTERGVNGLLTSKLYNLKPVYKS